MLVRSLLLSALCWSCASVMAQTPNNCEPLRLQIEQKIAANGVREFSVTVVDVEADAAGQVVGSCGQGRQKIVYVVDRKFNRMSVNLVPPGGHHATEPGRFEPSLRARSPRLSDISPFSALPGAALPSSVGKTAVVTAYQLTR